MKEEDYILNETQSHINSESWLETRSLVLSQDNRIDLFVVRALRKHYSYVFYIVGNNKVFLMKSKTNNMFGFGYNFSELYRYGKNMPYPTEAELYKKELYDYINNEIKKDIRLKKMERIINEE